MLDKAVNAFLMTSSSDFYAALQALGTTLTSSQWNVSHPETRFRAVYLVWLSIISTLMLLLLPPNAPLDGCMCSRFQGCHLLPLLLFLIKELTSFDHIRSQYFTVNTLFEKLKYYPGTAVLEVLIVFMCILKSKEKCIGSDLKYENYK